MLKARLYLGRYYLGHVYYGTGPAPPDPWQIIGSLELRDSK